MSARFMALLTEEAEKATRVCRCPPSVQHPETFQRDSAQAVDLSGPLTATAGAVLEASPRPL